MIKKATINVNICMDTNLKQQFKSFCADMGMPVLTAFNIFAQKAIIGDRPNTETMKL